MQVGDGRESTNSAYGNCSTPIRFPETYDLKKTVRLDITARTNCSGKK
jgi:hypothetical protein